MTTLCIKVIISGKVQNVFFRDSTQKKAKALKLTGWVKNTNDGNVELMACGERDHITELTDWLWQGPPDAEVSNVQWEEIPSETFDDFTIEN